MVHLMYFGEHCPSSKATKGTPAEGGISVDLVLNFSGIFCLAFCVLNIFIGRGIESVSIFDYCYYCCYEYWGCYIV